MQGQTESCPNFGFVRSAFEYKYKTDSIVPLAHPVGEDFGDLLLGAHEMNGSLVPAFCRAYTKVLGVKTLAVHAAKGATTLSDWAPSGKRYAFAIKKAKAAIDWVRRHDEVGKVYYVWLQGESDALAGTSRKAYADAITKYKNALKSDLKIDGFGIIRVGFFSSDDYCDRAIMAAQEDVSAFDDDFVMLTRLAGKLSRDERYLNPYAAGHYNNDGMELLGSVAGSALARFACGEKNVADDETVQDL